MKRLVAALAAATLTAAACTAEVSTPPPTSAAPTAQDESEAVEAALLEHLEAVAADDHERKVTTSVGELQALADWQLMTSLAFGSAFGTLEVERVEVTDVGATEARAELDALIRLAGFESDPPAVLSGPAVLAHTGGGWKVRDYVLNGRRRTASVWTSVRGRVQRSGVTFTVTGVDAPADSILVVFTATSVSEQTFTMQPATILTEDGRRLGFGEPSATQRALLPTAPLESYVYWSGRDLRAEDRSFELLIDLTSSTGGTMRLEIPVQLLE